MTQPKKPYFTTPVIRRDALDDVKWLMDRLAAVERERDDWKEKHRLQGEAHKGDMRNALADLDNAEAALLSLQRAVRALKHFTLPMHGHSTCAADPDVVKWDDVLALLPDPAGTP